MYKRSSYFLNLDLIHFTNNTKNGFEISQVGGIPNCNMPSFNTLLCCFELSLCLFAEAGVMRAPGAGAGACAAALVCAGVPRWACTSGARAPPNPADYAASGAPHHPRPVFPHVDAINHRFAIWSVPNANYTEKA